MYYDVDTWPAGVLILSAASSEIPRREIHYNLATRTWPLEPTATAPTLVDGSLDHVAICPAKFKNRLSHL